MPNCTSRGFAPIILIIAIAAIAIPATIFLVNQRMDIRQHASVATDCTPDEYLGGTYCASATSCYDEYCNSAGDGVRRSNYSGSPSCDHCAAQFPSIPSPTLIIASTQSCDQKYGSGYECSSAFSSNCASPNLIQSAMGTNCDTGGAYACCKEVAGPPPGPSVIGATLSCNGSVISMTFSARASINATSYQVMYGAGSYSGAVQGTSGNSTITISGFSPNTEIYYNMSACNAQGCNDDPNGYFGPVNTGTCGSTPASCGALGACNNEGLSRCSGNSVYDCTDSCWTLSYSCNSQICKAAGGNASCIDEPTPTPSIYSCSVKYNDPNGIYDCKTSSQCASSGGTYFDGTGTTCPNFSSSYGCCKQNNGINNCGTHNCSTSETCIQSYSGSLDTMCIGIGNGAWGSYCAKPDGNPNNQACTTQYCNPATRTCSNIPTPTPTPTLIPTPQATATCPNGTGGSCSGSGGKCLNDKAYTCDGSCWQFVDLCDPETCNNGVCKKGNGVGCGLNEDCASNNCQSKNDGTHVCCPTSTSWCSYTNACQSTCDHYGTITCKNSEGEYCSSDPQCGGKQPKSSGNFYCSQQANPLIRPINNYCCTNNSYTTPTPVPYLCTSTWDRVEECYSAIDGCPAGFTQSTHEPSTSCNASAQICCTKPQTAPSCSAKFGEDFQCLANFTDECKFGSDKGSVGTSCESDAEFGMSCCKKAPYSCESNGGHCINPFSYSCNSLETQYAGISTCSSSNQVCCMSTETIKLYKLTDGARCNDDIIYDLFTGNNATIDRAVENCKAENKVCATIYGSIACIDKQTNNNKNKVSQKLFEPYCKDNKLYSSVVTQQQTGSQYVDALIEDCGNNNKSCSKINDAYFCSPVPIDTKQVTINRESRIPAGQGVNEGNNKTIFNNIMNSVTRYHKSSGAKCVTKDGVDLLYPASLLAMQMLGYKEPIVCEQGSKCVEIDQDIMCAPPSIVNDTPVTHYYCGDRHENKIDTGVSDFVNSAIENITIGLVINKMTLGAIDTKILPHAIKLGGGDIKIVLQELYGPGNPEGYITDKKPVKIYKSEMSSLLSSQLEGILTKDAAQKVAQYIMAEPVMFFISPNDVALFLKTAKQTISYYLVGNIYDYWLCSGNQLLKRRIDVNNGHKEDETRDCEPKGTSCQLFDEFCVVCTNKTYTTKVLGTSTNASSNINCPLKWQGDANCDGKVGNQDLLIFRKEKLSKIGTSADFNGDGKVDGADLDHFAPTQ